MQFTLLAASGVIGDQRLEHSGEPRPEGRVWRFDRTHWAALDDDHLVRFVHRARRRPGAGLGRGPARLEVTSDEHIVGRPIR